VHGQGLLSLAAFHDTELDALAGLQAGDARRQCIGADVNVATFILGQEAEAFFGVVKPHLANRHVKTSLAFFASSPAVVR
jgi:hypothetical protein